MLKLSNTFLFQKGFSILQVVVAMGLMSVLSLSFMQMMKNQNKSQRSVRASMELDNFINEFRAVMSLPGTCKKSFGGKTYHNGLDIQHIIRPNGIIKYKVGSLYGLKGLRLKGIRLTEFSSDSASGEAIQMGLASMEIDVEKRGKVYGAKNMTRKISIILYLDQSKKIVGCTRLGGGGINTAGPTVSPEAIKEAIDAFGGVANKNLKKGKPSAEAERVRKLIENNPSLKALQESIMQIKKTNQQMDKMFKE